MDHPHVDEALRPSGGELPLAQTPTFCSLEIPTEWIRCAHIREGSLLYPPKNTFTETSRMTFRQIPRPTSQPS